MLLFFMQQLSAYHTIWIAIVTFNIIIGWLLKTAHNKLGIRVSVKAGISILSGVIALKIEKKEMLKYKEIEKVDEEF